MLKLEGSNADKISTMRSLMRDSEAGLKGLDELEELFSLVASAGVGTRVELDLSLARGLNYYTGAIFEVKACGFAIGSICGGGRYDNLTGIFGLPDMSGVGVSFGADRIYDVMKGLGKFPEALSAGSRLLFANLGADDVRYVLGIASALRGRGIPVEVYPDAAKLKKQFDYASRKAIPFISITGESERTSGRVNLKNLATGVQQDFACDDLDAMASFLAG